MMPSDWASAVTGITTTSTGATCFTMTDQALAALRAQRCAHSSIIVFGSNPANEHAGQKRNQSAMTELEMKSAKSNGEKPSCNGWMNESTL